MPQFFTNKLAINCPIEGKQPVTGKLKNERSANQTRSFSVIFGVTLPAKGLMGL